MSKVRYVRTEIPNGCVVSCLAMVTGKTFKQTLKGILEYWQETGQFDGVEDNIFEQYLAQEGYAVQYVHQEYEPNFRIRKEWPPQPWAPIHVADVFDEGMHAVVMLSDGRVLDPNDRKKKKLTDYHRCFGVVGIWKVSEPRND